jgi:hypothetical protein
MLSFWPHQHFSVLFLLYNHSILSKITENQYWAKVPLKIVTYKLGVLAHVCNPSYMGGGDGEAHSSKLIWAKT